MAELKTLLAKRGRVKSQVTKFKNHVASINPEELDEAAYTNLECRFAKFEQLWESFDRIQSEIELLNEDESEIERDTFETSYFEMQTKVKCILKSKTSENELNSSNHSKIVEHLNDMHEHNLDIRLPVIHLPIFKGTYEGWYNFKEIFEALITNNSNLSKVKKYYYLKSSLQGEAAHITENLEITESSFDTAWKLLKDRFENKRLIVHNYIQSLLDMPSSNKESLTNLRLLQDTTVKNIQSLKHIGVDTDSWDVLITHIITNKFDLTTRKEWEKYPLKQDLATLDELLKFIGSKCSMLETLESHKTDNRANVSANEKSTFRSRFHSGNSNRSNDTNQSNYTKHAFVATTQQTCPICKQSHYIYYCDTFKELPIQRRIDEIKQLKLCANCLKNGHFANNCKHSNCRKCGKKHNTLLHLESNASTSSNIQTLATNSEGSPSHAIISNSAISNSSEVILSTAVVYVHDNNGIAHKCKCLLDTGSQSSFISENFVKTLRIRTIPFESSVVGISQINSDITAKVKINIVSLYDRFTTTVTCLILPQISEDLPAITSEVKVPRGIKLADPDFKNGGNIQLLIGSDLFWNLLYPQQINLGHGQPILHKSKLGWIIAGPIQHTRMRPNKTISNVAITNNELNQSLTKFWETEREEYTKYYAPDEVECESHFVETHSRNKNGRFVVRLPFNSKISQLGESHQGALDRFYALEKRLNKNPILKQKYIEFLAEYEKLGHMQRVNTEAPEPLISYYIPHHAVFKNDKIRVVFDASNKTDSGISLNDAQYTGPTIQTELFLILISFRKHDYVLSCDIVKMFRQILVHPDDRRFQQILWRYDSAQPIQRYELTTVVFGMTASPYLAIRCIQELANSIDQKYPDIAHTLKNEVYVDDILCGAQSVEKLLAIKSKLIETLNGAGFELSKFNTNVSNEKFNESGNIVQINSQHDSKTLGVQWDSTSDTIRYSFKFSQHNAITKRNILAEIAGLFDPLGILGPVIVTAKMFIQRLWQERLSWDEQLPNNLEEQWIQFRSQLPKLNAVSVPRHVLCKQATYVEIHGFADASEKGYGACIYIKSKNDANRTLVRLLCAKSKVAPVKVVSLPRLELSAAVLLAKLLNTIERPLNLPIQRRYLWSDSTITLHWIGASPHRWKTYVANRITTIQNLSNIGDWYHVRSKDNPADIISRGLTPNELITSELWFHGPQWLTEDESKWPISQLVVKPETVIPETRVVTNVAISQRNDLLDIIEKHSNLHQMQSVFAYVLRFIHNLRSKGDDRMSGGLTVIELDKSLHTLIKLVQIQQFPHEISTIKREKQVHKSSNLLALNPFLDRDQLLRVGGRLSNSTFPYDKKFPILLPNKHKLTQLIFRDVHVRSLHCGSQLLLATVRQRFWPISGGSLAKDTVRNCINCFKAKPRGFQYIMGNLPADRVTPGKVFNVTGTDFCGPFMIKERRTRNRAYVKIYICVFVCYTTKACHLEIVSDLTTESFIAAFRRFVSRRGKCTKIYSDNGTNYVGANHEIQNLYDFLKKNESVLQQNFQREGITWVFSPARTPNFGGIFEACVKSTKFHLRRVIGENHLSYEEFLTIVTQVEACLNSRPISPISNDPNDPTPLTPGHFLVGGPLTAIPEHDWTNSKENTLSRWQLVQKITQHFWQRWSLEYIAQLQSRNKWKIDNPNPFSVGDLVLIKGESTNTLQWPTGRVIKCHCGGDGVTRVLSIKMPQGVIKRGVNKVFRLPIDGVE